MPGDLGGNDDEPILVSPVAEAHDPDGYDELVPVRGVRVPRWLVLAGAGVLAAGLVTALASRQHGRHAAAPPTPSSTAASASLPALSPPPEPRAGDPVDVATISAVDVAVDAQGRLLLLTTPPSQLLTVVNGVVASSSEAPPSATGIVVDVTSAQVWLVAPDIDGSRVIGYSEHGLRVFAQAHVPAPILGAAALDGRLWMATPQGVFVASRGSTRFAGRLPGFTGAVETIAADPRRDRLLAVSSDYALLTVDASGVRVVGQLRTVLPTSIVVVGDRIWLIGFGAPGTTRLALLDPRTLLVTPIGDGDRDAPQGAEGWPGDAVIWTQDAYGSALVCRDARDGHVVGTLSGVTGPVISRDGTAFALNGGFVMHLPTSASCPG